METGSEKLSDSYRHLADHMEDQEFLRGLEDPSERLTDLEQKLDENGVRDTVDVPIRSADGEMEDISAIMDKYQRLMALRIEQFDVERAVRGLVGRIAEPLDTRKTVSVRVEQELFKNENALKELLRAVSAETGKELRMIARIEGETARLHFETQVYRASTWVEKALGPIGRAAAKAMEFVTGTKTVSREAKLKIDTCGTPGGFMREYYNEWVGFVWCYTATQTPGEKYDPEIQERAAMVIAKQQHDEHGVLIRPFRQYFPQDAHDFAINDKNRAAVEKLDKLAEEANELYRQGQLKAGKLRELAAQAHKIIFGE